MNVYDRKGFVQLDKYIPDISLDIRYYSDYNFTGTRVDGYKRHMALLTEDAAKALKAVNKQLRAIGYGLLVYDAYRPLKAVRHFARWAKDTEDTKMKEIFYPDIDKKDLFRLGYIAEYSSHCKGSTVDLTLTDKGGNPLDMGGYFDFFGNISGRDYTEGLSEIQISNRRLLKDIMCKNGFSTIESEWWHFTLKDEPYPDTYFDFDVE